MAKKMMGIMVATVLLSGALVGYAQAATEGSQSAGIQLGFVMPQGSKFTDVAKSGISYGANYLYQITPEIAAGGEINMMGFGKKDDKTVSVTQIMPMGKYSFAEFGGGYIPFAEVGLAMNSVKVKYTGGAKTKSPIGFVIGGGVEKVFEDKYIVGADLRYESLGKWESGTTSISMSAFSIGVKGSYKFK